LAIARAALREGIETLPTARLAGPEREIRQLALYRERLLDMRTRLSNELRWQLHDLWPDWELPAKGLTHPSWQTKVQARLARAEQTTQVWVARDTIRRIRELSRATKDLYAKIAALVKQVAPQLLAEPGIGVLLAAKFIGEIAGIDRFTSDAQLARLAGCAPIPVSSGRSDRYRLDPGGNRRLNSAFYMLAVIRISHDPRTAVYLANNAPTAKPNAKPSATSNATSPAASTTSYTTPTASQPRPARHRRLTDDRARRRLRSGSHGPVAAGATKRKPPRPLGAGEAELAAQPCGRAVLVAVRGRYVPSGVPRTIDGRCSGAVAPHRHPQHRDQQADTADDHENDADRVEVESVGGDADREAKNRAYRDEK
jgi:transposase